MFTSSADTLYICYCIDKDMGSRRREEVFEAVSTHSDVDGTIRLTLFLRSSSIKVQDERSSPHSHRGNKYKYGCLSHSTLVRVSSPPFSCHHRVRRPRILSSSLRTSQKITVTSTRPRRRRPRSLRNHDSPSVGARACWTRSSAPRCPRIKRVTTRVCRTRICPCSRALISSDL